MRTVKALSAAPLVAVLLLAAVALGSAPRISVGLPLRIGEFEPCYPGDRRVVVIQALADGSVKINVDPVNLGELGKKLDNIFRTRAVRLAWVTADSDVPFGRLVGVIDASTKHLDHIALLPRSRVLNRTPYPGEDDICVAMSFTARDANTSDRQLALWH